MVKRLNIISVAVISLLALLACQKECTVSNGMKEIILMMKDGDKTKVTVVDTPPSTLAICCIGNGELKSETVVSSYDGEFNGYRTGFYTSAWHDYNTGEDKGINTITFYAANVERDCLGLRENQETGTLEGPYVEVDNSKDYIYGKVTSDLIHPTLEMKHILARIGTVKAICNGGDNYYNNGKKGYFKDLDFLVTFHSSTVDPLNSSGASAVASGLCNIETDEWFPESNGQFLMEVPCQTVSNVCSLGEEPEGYYVRRDEWVIPFDLKVSFSCVYCTIVDEVTTEKTLEFTNCSINLLPGKINNIEFNIIYDDGNVELTYTLEESELPDENVIVDLK